MSCDPRRGCVAALGWRFVAAALSVVCAACGGCDASDGDEVASVRAERRMAARNELVRGGITPLLREGDVVFRRGGGVVSRAVLAADRGGVYSHVGVVARVGGEFVVVHVVPGESGGARDAARIETPEEFFAPSNASRGAVMRLRRGDGVRTGGDAGNDGAKSDDAAGGPRTDEITVGAARSAVRLARAGVLFDHRYDLADTVRMYCTELVWHVFRGEGVDLSGGRRTRTGLPGMGGTYIMPSDIQAAPELEYICGF